MNAESIRCVNDRKLFEMLLEDRTVRRINEQIEKREAEGPMGIRRHLLGSSVRLSRRMARALHRTADKCVERLDMNIPLELYVYPGGPFNAACFKPEEGRLFVIFSSGLLETFEGSQLCFVMGHELGHHVYHHHDIPIGYVLRGPERPDPKLALDLFAWSRYAEISADRAGAHCARDMNGVAHALFKLASGLSGNIVRFSLEDFLAQVDEMQVEDAVPGQGAPREDWFSTHPFSPLRVKALKLFDESALAHDGGMEPDELEVAVQGLMSLMEPSYIEGRTPASEAMRRLLFAGAIALANADGMITKQEIEVFEKFMGERAFGEHLNIDKLIAELPSRIEQVREHASVPKRMQVLRDLCLFARAEGEPGRRERRVLEDIADGLGVERAFCTQVLSADCGPD